MLHKVRTLILASVLVGVSLTLAASPGFANHDYDEPPPPAATDNPDLTGTCGLDFMLVLDRSGSVEGSETAVEDAAASFLGALAGTGSRAAVVSFANDAETDVDPLNLTPANLSTFTGAIDELDYEGATNWQAGLAQAYGEFDASFRPDLVIVITDGNPNRWDVNQGDGNGFEQEALNKAIVEANHIKAAAEGNAHILALGVTGVSGGGSDPINVEALKDISGDDPWTGSNILTADWTTVEGFGELDEALKGIATALCGGTITVTKVLGESNPSGWEFTVNQGAKETGVDGTALWTLPFDGPEDDPISVEVTESDDRNGSSHTIKSAACFVGEGEDERAVGERSGDTISLELGPRDAVRCVFENRELVPGLSIVKKGPDMAHPGDEIEFTIEVTNTGEVDLFNLVVEDDLVGDFSESILELTAGQSESFTVPYTVPATKDDVVNTASVCPAEGPARELEVEGPAEGCEESTWTVDVINPAITIVKTADPVSITGSGEVTYTYVVENTGDVTLANVVVTDDVLGAIGSVASLAPGAKTTLTKTVAVDPSSPARNVGTATGTDPLGDPVSDDDDAVITVVAGQTTTKAPDPVVVPAGPAPADRATPEVLAETVVEPQATLPRTGAPVAVMVLTGLALLTGGLGFRWAGRRRHGEHS